jgi:2,6-dihydroxypyridine 3-monooxygenase
VSGPRVVVVGGSIGGLNAALWLAEAGADVAVHERSGRALEARGAGIGLLDATSRYLQHAKVDLDAVSVGTEVIRYLDHAGATTVELAHRYRFSSWNTVYRQLAQRFPAERYHLGSEVTGLEPHADRVEVTLASGARSAADLVVCADGIGSTSRQRLQPGAKQTYAGYVAWRGTVAEADLSAATREALEGAIIYHVYANSHALFYPIPTLEGDVTPGRRLINMVWYRNYTAGPDLDRLLTGTDGVRRELSVPPGLMAPEHVAELRTHAAARLPAPLAEVVGAIAEPFVQVIFDIEIERMAFGRVCLVGDAAFAVRPHCAAGTAKACEDGWALAEAVRSGDDIRVALRRWESVQLTLGRRLLERARRIGERSQVGNDWNPSDPELIFGLHEPGR